jgi:Flp pilus assembly pilin Flp
MHKQGTEPMMESVWSIVGMIEARLRCEGGQTMAEYGILIAVIALIVIVAAVVLGSSISALFGSTASQV